MPNNGNVYSHDEMRDMSSKYADNGEWDKVDGIDNLKSSNRIMNRAFDKGKRARKGETYRTGGGEIYTNGTGTNSSAFKSLK